MGRTMGRERRYLMLLVGAGVLVVIGVYASVCNGLEGGEEREVYVKGTPAYERRVKQFRLSEKDAAKRVVAHVREKWHEPERRVLVGVHILLVNSRYVFARPLKSGASLHGYYVDGNSGEVEFVATKEKLTEKDLRRLKERE